MQNNKKNLIVDMTFEFAKNVVKYCEMLQRNGKYVIAGQLFKSGTSIGANVREAQNAESKNDFIHKIKIACKEADETEYWLLLCKELDGYQKCDKLLEDCFIIIKILSKIVSSSKMKLINPTAAKG